VRLKALIFVRESRSDATKLIRDGNGIRVDVREPLGAQVVEHRVEERPVLGSCPMKPNR
jgi:hypothetical protein